MTRSRLAICAAGLSLAALAAPTANAQPNSYRLETRLAPGERAVLRVGTFPVRGEFRFVLAASSDDEKRVTLTQRRVGGTPFTVIDTAAGGCEGAAGTVVCRDVTTPAAPAGRSWRFVLRNAGARDVSVRLTIAFRVVRSAG